jgi:hypothetical protein
MHPISNQNLTEDKHESREKKNGSTVEVWSLSGDKISLRLPAPSCALDAKREISRMTGIPLHMQELYREPEVPTMDCGGTNEQLQSEDDATPLRANSVLPVGSGLLLTVLEMSTVGDLLGNYGMDQVTESSRLLLVKKGHKQVGLVHGKTSLHTFKPHDPLHLLHEEINDAKNTDTGRHVHLAGDVSATAFEEHHCALFAIPCLPVEHRMAVLHTRASGTSTLSSLRVWTAPAAVEIDEHFFHHRGCSTDDGSEGEAHSPQIHSKYGDSEVWVWEVRG